MWILVLFATWFARCEPAGMESTGLFAEVKGGMGECRRTHCDIDNSWQRWFIAFAVLIIHVWFRWAMTINTYFRRAFSCIKLSGGSGGRLAKAFQHGWSGIRGTLFFSRALGVLERLIETDSAGVCCASWEKSSEMTGRTEINRRQTTERPPQPSTKPQNAMNGLVHRFVLSLSISLRLRPFQLRSHFCSPGERHVVLLFFSLIEN